MMESVLRSLTRASHCGGVDETNMVDFLEAYPAPRTYKREGVSMIELKKGTVFLLKCHF